MVCTAVHSFPKTAEDILKQWIGQLISAERYTPEVFRAIELLIACNTRSAYKFLARMLCDSPADFIHTLVMEGVSILTSDSCRRNLIRELRCLSKDNMTSRCLFLLYALADVNNDLSVDTATSTEVANAPVVNVASTDVANIPVVNSTPPADAANVFAVNIAISSAPPEMPPSL